MWGSIPEWVTAIAAVLALAAAVWAGITSRRLVDVESGRDEVAARRRAREQARQVSAWCVVCPDAPLPVGLLVQNSSTAPVFQMTVESTDAQGQHRPPLHLTIVPPGDYVVTADEQFHWTFPEDARTQGHVRPVTKKDTWMVQSLTFVDSSGVRWHRDQHGTLSESTDQSSDAS